MSEADARSPEQTVPTLKTPFLYGWAVVGVAATLGFLGTGFHSYSRGIFMPSLPEELADGSRFHIAMGFAAELPLLPGLKANGEAKMPPLSSCA